jgi:[histone H3]-lysine4 N-trimethyltransferase ASH1L
LEYRGEMISTEECEDRMATMYAGRNNYYFLNIDANTVLDAGRKGSEARFANHCCNPVCITQGLNLTKQNGRIEKWFIKGEPRIGVFAGKNGLEAGEEITYGLPF